MNTERPKRVFVSGHRNPDTDSIASAYALAALRALRDPGTRYVPICPGVLPERADFLFRRFGVEPPAVHHDVFLRMRDLLEPATAIAEGTTLFAAVETLRRERAARLPVVSATGKYLGMLSAATLLSQLLNIGNDNAEDLTGRHIFSSLALIRDVLEAEAETLARADALEDFEVYVAAMRPESFAVHVPVAERKNLVIIVGDRPEIHRCALEHAVRLLIVTGTSPVAPEILSAARERGVSVMRTRLDSATVARRLKFSMPVERAPLAAEETLALAPDDRLRDFRKKMLRDASDLFPVTDAAGTLLGVVRKKHLSEPPPHRMILVDHNEPTQYLPGADELPVVEVVDHHRIGMFTSETPIRFTGDVVGSTCTLVAREFFALGETPTPALAGLLLGGLVSDTLMLKSPTTAPLDREICAKLEKLCGVSAETLMAEMTRIDSALTTKSANAVISGDRKDYTEGDVKFALAQVEETELELLRARKRELSAQMRFRVEVENLLFFGLLVTDAIHEISELLIVGDDDVLRALPYEKLEDNLYALPGVLSRKKQLLPQMLSICSALRRE